MKNKNAVLLKTLLKSTSIINILKTSKDKKRKGRLIGGIVGMALLYAMIVFYCIIVSIGYAQYGLADKMAGMCALLIGLIAFVFTLIKTNSYLLNFKEYDMLMALPFTEKTIVGSKFLYMFVKSLPWYLTISLSFMVGYGMAVSPAWYVYPLWIVLTLPISMIPMLIASLFGFAVARISAAFKHWKAVQAVLLFAFVGLAFMSRFFMEKIFRDNAVSDIVESVAGTTDNMGKYYPPMKWFEDSVTGKSISGALLLIGVAILLFEVIFFIYSRSYKKINGTMKTGASRRNFKLKEQKKRSAVRAMAMKELKRFTGSINYLVNMGVGYVLALGLSIASLFVGLEKIIGVVTEGAPITGTMVLPAIPFFVYLLTGMIPTTTASPSWEGKNYWIIKSLPMTDFDIYGGKVLANLYISIPTQLIATLLLCISAKAGVIETVGYMILGVVMCLFSAIFGCACGLHFMRLDGENEIEVVKQGAAVMIYMFPNMILTVALMVGSIILSSMIGKTFVVIAAMFLYAILTVVFSLRIKALAQKR